MTSATMVSYATSNYSFWFFHLKIILVRLQDNNGDKWSTVRRATQSVVEGTLANVPDCKRVGCEMVRNERPAVRATEDKQLLLQGSACQPSPLSMPETIFQASMVPRPPARIKVTTFEKTMPRSSNIIELQSTKMRAAMISKKISKFLLHFLFWWHLSSVWSYRAWSSTTEMHSNNLHAYKRNGASWIEYPKSNATMLQLLQNNAQTCETILTCCAALTQPFFGRLLDVDVAKRWSEHSGHLSNLDQFETWNRDLPRHPRSQLQVAILKLHSISLSCNGHQNLKLLCNDVWSPATIFRDFFLNPCRSRNFRRLCPDLKILSTNPCT